MKQNQSGAAPILILVAVIGIVSVLAISSGAPLKNKLLSSIFPKDQSFAAAAVNPMPVISRNLPAFASSQQWPASGANDNDYSTYWRSAGPGWLAYNLSSIPPTNRSRVLVAWYNDPITSEYDHTHPVAGNLGYNNPGSYTIQANPAPTGTSAPTSGWVTLATVTGNKYHSRTHLVDLTGHNWIRINVTAIDGSSGNMDAAINFDIHDASVAADDSWIFYGDSITQDGMHHEQINTTKNFAQLINAANPAYFPAFEDGGIGFLQSAEGAAGINTWLSVFPGKYAVLSYGANDAEACVPPATYNANLRTMIDTALALGKTPVIPKFTKSSATNGCGAGLIAEIDKLYLAYPQIIKGPDFWTNPPAISGDGIHPSAAGYVTIRQAWATTMLANVYNGTATPIPSSVPSPSPSPSASAPPSPTISPTPAPSAPANTVTVTTTETGTIKTQFSTNDAWPGLLAGAPQGQAKLTSLRAPYIRIHAGTDGAPPALPEVDQGSWNFNALDTLVNGIFAANQEPLMNIRYAPDYMWSCYPNTYGKTGSQPAGNIKDATFAVYAQYTARLVGYYNKGSMTTSSGTVITNPAGTSHKITYWEPWNEPDLNNETPCAPNSGNGLTPVQYLTMWNAVTAAMLQIDPTIKFVGPATAGSQFGSSTATGNQYIDTIMTNAVTKPTAISFHSYGYWDNTVTDKWIFDGDNTEPSIKCCGGVTDFINGVTSVRSKHPTTPIWLTEVNVNADWGGDTHKRPWSEFSAAWWGTLFKELAPLGAELIHQYLAVEAPQFGLFDYESNSSYMAYYVIQLINDAFPSGSKILSSSSSQNGVLSLAVRKPDGNISVMVVNRQLVSNSVKSSCGTGGVAANITIALQGITPASATLQQLDKTNVNCSTNAAIAPTVNTVNVSQPITINFPSYGLAILNITPAQSGPSPSPAKPGDLDGNNTVDIFDYNQLLTDFGKTQAGLPADIDKNNKVDIFDYNLLLTNFGK